jgi:hypothetical protein
MGPYWWGGTELRIWLRWAREYEGTGKTKGVVGAGRAKVGGKRLREETVLRYGQGEESGGG